MIPSVIQSFHRDPKRKKEFEAAMVYAKVTDFEETSFFLKMLDSLGLSVDEVHRYIKGMEEAKKKSLK